MAAAKHRVSIVRISRRPVHQISPDGNHDEPDKTKSKYDHSHLDKTPPNIPAERETPRKTKTDSVTLTNPLTSNSTNDLLNRQHIHLESRRPSISIQRQPIQPDKWIKHSPEHENHPDLIWKATGKWNNAFCSLFDDFNTCCYACACWCCFRHQISTMMEEDWYLWFVNCTPLMALRTKFRQQYAIRGSIAEDFCLSTFCPICVGVQLVNEGRHYGHQIFT